MTRNALAMVMNAVSNASRTPVSDKDIIAVLATGEGPGPLVRALFSDCSLETLDRLGETAGLSRAQIKSAYSHAKQQHAAANAEMDEA